MLIREILFSSFKNLDGKFHLKNGINLLIMPNGWGKTNFLEAIDYFAHLKSFRNISDNQLKKWDDEYGEQTPADFLKVELDLKNRKSKKLGFVISDKSKKVFINQTSTTPKKFREELSVLLYSPHNADIVSSPPEIRRNEFDRILSQIFPGYWDKLKEYKFVVRSRNKILQKLKGRMGNTHELDYWSERLIALGQDIVESRVVFMKEIEETLQSFGRELINGNDSLLEIVYESKVLADDEIILEKKIAENADKEVRAGMSLYGPHRDDYVFNLNGRSLREFGSRGQQRLAGLVLIFSLHKYFSEKLEKNPVLLLDDIMSELDKDHRKRIEDKLKVLKAQIVLTSSEKEYFTSGFRDSVNSLA